MASKTSNLDLSIQGSSKFEFYFISLIFTLLALSIQSSKFGNTTADAFELLGWMSLVVSGLFGMSRLEWIPTGYAARYKRDELEILIRDIELGVSQGNAMVPFEDGRVLHYDEAIPILRKYIEGHDTTFESIDRKSHLKYAVQKWAFVIGIISIIASRAYIPFLNIYLALAA